MSNTLPTFIGFLTGTGALSTVALCIRQFIPYRAERERWRSVERLAERLGLDALRAIPA